MTLFQPPTFFNGIPGQRKLYLIYFQNWVEGCGAAWRGAAVTVIRCWQDCPEVRNWTYSQGGFSPLNLPSWVMENNSNIGNKEVIICHHSFLWIKATMNKLLGASDIHSLLGQRPQQLITKLDSCQINIMIDVRPVDHTIIWALLLAYNMSSAAHRPHKSDDIATRSWLV